MSLSHLLGAAALMEASPCQIPRDQTTTLSSSSSSSSSSSYFVQPSSSSSSSSPLSLPMPVGSRKSGKRIKINSNQRNILQKAFEENRLPSTSQRMKLAKQLNITPRSVQIWFQNQRQRLAAQARAGEPNQIDGEEDGEIDGEGEGEGEISPDSSSPSSPSSTFNGLRLALPLSSSLFPQGHPLSSPPSSSPSPRSYSRSQSIVLSSASQVLDSLFEEHPTLPHLPPSQLIPSWMPSRSKPKETRSGLPFLELPPLGGEKKPGKDFFLSQTIQPF